MTIPDLPPVMRPGISRFHHVGLLVPLLAVLALMVTARYSDPDLPQAVNALLAGTVVACIAYVLYTSVNDTMALPNAIMLGLLHAEFSVFTRSAKFPAATTIIFFLFMWTYALADIGHDIKH